MPELADGPCESGDVAYGATRRDPPQASLSRARRDSSPSRDRRAADRLRTARWLSLAAVLLRLPRCCRHATSASTTACTARPRSRMRARRPAVPRRLLVAGAAAPPAALRRRPRSACRTLDGPRCCSLVAGGRDHASPRTSIARRVAGPARRRCSPAGARHHERLDPRSSPPDQRRRARDRVRGRRGRGRVRGTANVRRPRARGRPARSWVPPAR